MYLILTRSFPPELGGMQNLMWGLANAVSKIDLVKVYADYELNHDAFDEKVSFSIERIKGFKLFPLNITAHTWNLLFGPITCLRYLCHC